jgi:hypothetical protein
MGISAKFQSFHLLSLVFWWGGCQTQQEPGGESHQLDHGANSQGYSRKFTKFFKILNGLFGILVLTSNSQLPGFKSRILFTRSGQINRRTPLGKEISK